MRVSIHLLSCFFANSRTEDSSTPPTHSSNVTFSPGSIVEPETPCVDPSIGVQILEISDSEEEIGVQQQAPLILPVRHQQLRRFQRDCINLLAIFARPIVRSFRTLSAIGADGLKVWADEDGDDSPDPAPNPILTYGNPFGVWKDVFSNAKLSF